VYFGVTEKRVIIYFVLRSFLSTDCEAPLLFSFQAGVKVENLRFSSFLLKLFFLPPYPPSSYVYTTHGRQPTVSPQNPLAV
jgi:hypothetical protein